MAERNGSLNPGKWRHYYWPRLKPFMLFLASVLSLTACSSSLIEWPTEIELFLENSGLMRDALHIFAILGGLALLLAGWKIYRFVVALPGFFIGAILGAQIGFRLGESELWAIAGLLLAGMIGAWLALVVHDLAVFVIGAIGGVVIASSLWDVFSSSPSPLWVEVIGIVVGGLVLLALARLRMILLSSAVGAGMFTWGIHGGLMAAIVLFVVGVIVQYGWARSMGVEPFSDPEPST